MAGLNELVVVLAVAVTIGFVGPLWWWTIRQVWHHEPPPWWRRLGWLCLTVGGGPLGSLFYLAWRRRRGIHP